MGKKVGIITIIKVNNYGAELQAYATQRVLQLMGYDAEIIDYLFYKNPRHIRTKGSRSVFSVSIKKRLAEFLYPKISKLKRVWQRNTQGEERDKRFKQFHTRNTRFSQEFRTYEDLVNDCPLYDAYIAGSDQIWNPGIYSSLDPYLLKFVPRGKKRISYASSFGVSDLPTETWDYYKRALQQFDKISVREEGAINIVKEVSGENAEWVLDPTLLLNKEEWEQVSKPLTNIPTKYILLYELTPCPYLKRLALFLAKEKGIRVARITKDVVRMEQDDEIVNITDAGPAEFLWLFGHADFVVTNSFHGTAFSINMNKDFYVVTPSRKKNNSRQQSILKLFGLSERLLPEDSPFPNIRDLTIDYGPINSRLEELRVISKTYLRNAING